MLLLEITHCNNVVLKGSIFTHKSPIGCSNIIEHERLCLAKYSFSLKLYVEVKGDVYSFMTVNGCWLVQAYIPLGTECRILDPKFGKRAVANDQGEPAVSYK